MWRQKISEDSSKELQDALAEGEGESDSESVDENEHENEEDDDDFENVDEGWEELERLEVRNRHGPLEYPHSAPETAIVIYRTGVAALHS